MDVNGQWVGYGLGDVTAYVQQIKRFLVAKFAYAAPLQASLAAGGTAAQTYDQTTVDVVTEMQQAYLADKATIPSPSLAANGIMNYAWQVRCGLVLPPEITLFTVQGTGVDMFDTDSPQPYGAAQYVAHACPNVVVQPVGNYPASITNPPMGVSAQDGVDELVRLCTASGGPGPFYRTGPIILFGYSQGAIVCSHFWRDQILNPAGMCHNRVRDVLAAVTFGNPCRATGVAHGNDAAGWGPSPVKDGVATGGIAGPDCLTAEQTPLWWCDYVWLGADDGQTELYTANPNGTAATQAQTGNVGTLVYNAVLAQTFGTVLAVLEALGEPVGMFVEIYNGLTFLAAGPNADHYDYDWLPAIEYLTGVCQTWTANYVHSGGTVT